MKHVEGKIYERNGWLYLLESVGGHRHKTALKTKSLELARAKLVQKGSGRDILAELDLMRQLMAHVVASGINGGVTPTTQPNLTAPVPAPIKQKLPLRKILDNYLDSRDWSSEQTEYMYRSRSNKLVKICETWDRFEEMGPYDIWRKSGSNSIRNHMRALLVGFFEYAKKKKLIADPDRWEDELKKLKKLNVQPRILHQINTPEEMEEFFQQLEYSDPQGAVLCRFLAYTGARTGGAKTLTWEKVDRDFSKLQLLEKGRKTRILPLGSKAQELLRTMAKNASGSRVFPWISTASLDRVRRSMKKAAKLKGFKLPTFHILRHWFATQAVLQGVPFKIVSDWLGHNDGGLLVSKVYGHLCDKTSREMMQKMKV